MGFAIPDEPDPDVGITLSHQEFLDAVARLQKLDFPIERDPAEAWPDFVGWRANYELAAYTVAYALDAVPAMWSGPRRRPTAPVAPLRPAARPGQVTSAEPPRTRQRRSRRSAHHDRARGRSIDELAKFVTPRSRILSGVRRTMTCRVLTSKEPARRGGPLMAYCAPLGGSPTIGAIGQD